MESGSRPSGSRVEPVAREVPEALVTRSVSSEVLEAGAGGAEAVPVAERRGGAGARAATAAEAWAEPEAAAQAELRALDGAGWA